MVRANFCSDKTESLLDLDLKPTTGDETELSADMKARAMHIVIAKVKFLDGTNIADACDDDAQKFFAELHTRCSLYHRRLWSSNCGSYPA